MQELMGLQAPLRMEQLAEARKLSNNLDNPPDSWEMADIEARMKLLRLPEPSCPTSMIDAPATTVPVAPIDQVDSVLREAVQNPRTRMTILRLEQEIERFFRNSKLQQYEFQPMRSSYLRLAAHRVAQHYFLQSSVVDSNSPEGGRIVARKTSETRYPLIRLADIPVESLVEEKPSPSCKVAIKQRPTKNTLSNGENSMINTFGAKKTLSKTMEERKEDYSRARARIFNGSDLLEGISENESADVNPVKIKDQLISESVKSNLNHNLVGSCGDDGSPSDILAGARVHKISEQELSSRAKMNGKVAIFRDIEKDRRDPDYDRNHEKYLQRFDPGFGLNAASAIGLQGIYGPVVNYNTEFPQLGGHTRPPIHIPQQPPPCPLPQRTAWMSPIGSLSYRSPETFMGGPFNQAHCAPHTATAMYMHSPQLAYHGPSISYSFSHDTYQQPFVQPPRQTQTQQHQQQQPEASINQARCR